MADAKRLRVVVASAALGFALVMALGVTGTFGGGRALGAATTVTIISGDVQVRHGAAGEFVSAADGQLVSSGDTVRTADGARAVLTYFEGSTVSLEPNSELTVEAATSLTDGSTVVVMQQSLGRTWHVVTRLVTGNSKYEVRTPASTASVRGTAFEVDVDAERTVVTTTEGTVVDRVPDPERSGQTVDVPVPTGRMHAQPRGARPAPASVAPEPERTLTITLDEADALVVDTRGRANGIDKSGKRHVETPGAQLVKTADGKLQVVLPNVPDGRLEALVRKPGGGDVTVQTTVEDKGRAPVRAQGTVTAERASGQGRAQVDVMRDPDGKTNVKQSSPTSAPGGGAAVPGSGQSTKRP